MTVQHIRSPNLPADFNSIVVTDKRGLPRYWPIVWEALHGNALRKSTLSGKLAAIDRLYRFVAYLMGEDCLDSLLFESKYSEIESCLEAYFISLRNEAGRGNKSNYNRNWKTAFEFVREILIRNQVQNQNSDISFNYLTQRIERIERLYASLNVKRRPRRRPVRALSATQEAMAKLVPLLLRLRRASLCFTQLQKASPVQASVIGVEIFLALQDALVISYASCFITSKTKLARLHASHVFKDRPDLKDIHERVMNTRHKLVAHNELNKEVEAAVHITPCKDDYQVKFGAKLTLPSPREIHEFGQAIEHVYNHIRKVIDDKAKELEDAIGKKVVVSDSLGEVSEL